MVLVDCCPQGELPEELYATIFNEADCPCALGTVVRLSWNGSRWVGSAPMGSCGSTIGLELYCGGGIGFCRDLQMDYQISSGSSSIGERPGDGCTCDPLMLIYSWGMLDSDCLTDVAAAISVAVTSTPYPHPLPPPTRPCERTRPEGCCPEAGSPGPGGGPGGPGGGPPSGGPGRGKPHLGAGGWGTGVPGSGGGSPIGAGQDKCCPADGGSGNGGGCGSGFCSPPNTKRGQVQYCSARDL